MEETLSVTVREASSALDLSESTVRRMAKNGTLEVVAGGGPLRLTRESVEACRRDMILRLGGFLAQSPPSEREQIDETTALRGRVSVLESDVQRLKQVIVDLRVAHAALLDAVGCFTEPAFPND